MFVRYGLLCVAFARLLLGQPGACFVLPVTTSGCPCSGAQTPCVQAYVGNANTALTANLASLASLPQPKIPSDLQLVGASANWIEHCPTPGTCLYNSLSVQEAFTKNILVKSGATGVAWNIDYFPYVTSSEYTTITGNTCAGTYSVATCARLANNLAFYDAYNQWLVGQGLTLRLAPISFGVPGGGSPWLICGLDPATMTVSQRIACESPYLQAMVEHNHALGTPVTPTVIIAAHEPTEADTASTGQTLSVSDWNTLVAGLCPAIHSATGGSGILCGSGYSMADAAYVSNVVGSVPSGMQQFGIDWYYRSADSTPSWTNQPGVYGGWCKSATSAGLNCQIDESGPWGHCPSGSGVACQTQLYEGCGWVNLDTYGIFTAWANYIPREASAIGASIASIFATQPYAAFQTAPIPNTACTDNSTSSYTFQMLGLLPGVPTSVGGAWKAGVAWWSTSLQGQVTLSGGAKIQ